MLAHAEASNTADRSYFAQLRRAETEVLLSATTALLRAGVLTEAEYEAKRQRLTAQL